MRIFKKKISKKLQFEEVIGGAHHHKKLSADAGGYYEATIEKPLPRWSATVFMIVTIIMVLIMLIRIAILTLVQHDKYLVKAENNRLTQQPLFAPRGVIRDRYKTVLAWNEVSSLVPYFIRKVRDGGSYGHIIGSIHYPQKDQGGHYWRTDTEGTSGLEKILDKRLRGKTGYQYLEYNKKKKEYVERYTEASVAGENIVVTIDNELQEELTKALKEYTARFGFSAGAGIVMDVTNGEILTMVSVPDFNPESFSTGNATAIAFYNSDKNNPLLNRAVYGGFGPGSIVKPFIAIAALNEGLITPEKTIYSSGEVVVPNPYNPDMPSRYRDWKVGGHGPVNVYYALAESVNTYFYAIGGGYKNQKGLGIAKIEKYAKIFGLGQTVPYVAEGKQPGQVPSPSWKERLFNESWRLGDTYISSLGQYGFVVTPLQMVRAIAALANNGTLLEPTLIVDAKQHKAARITGIDAKWYEVVQSAMRLTVTNGTGNAVNLPYVEVAMKTGTAQVGSKKDKVQSWSIGFWPYREPRFAFVFVGERGPAKETVNSSWVARKMFDWMYYKRPSYLKGTYPTQIEVKDKEIRDVIGTEKPTVLSEKPAQVE